MVWESLIVFAIVIIGCFVCHDGPADIEYGVPATQEEVAQKLLDTMGHYPVSYRIGNEQTTGEIIERGTIR